MPVPLFFPKKMHTILSKFINRHVTNEKLVKKRTFTFLICRVILISDFGVNGKLLPAPIIKRRFPMNYDSLPNDPVMLMSFLNTQLRDHYPSLEALAEAYEFQVEDVVAKLKSIDYEYDAKTNQFV